MKTKIVTLALLTSLFACQLFAQDRTTVNAASSEVSDNLDLRVVASIFGDAANLEDFERRLNDPELQISNLDLNQDNQVDYLRVIESVERNTHLIVIQSVLGRDVFQDVATVEVERDRNNRTQVQVVGDVYLYGNNYIYEPVYVQSPLIYNYFWAPSYRPYCSTWFWGYYPTYYYAWTPFPIFSYRNNIGTAINFNHHYNYVNYRNSQVAYNMHRGRRNNGYEMQHPNRSFNQRNEGYSNRNELYRTRTTGNGGTRNEVANYGIRNNRFRDITANNLSTQRSETPRENGIRNVTSSNPRTQRSETSRENGIRNVKSSNPRTQRNETPRYNENRIVNERAETSRSYYNQNTQQRNSSLRTFSQQRNTERNETQSSATLREFAQQRNAFPRNESQRNQGNTYGSRRS